MILEAAMVADAATVADGKLYVHGAGWDTIFSANFPTVHPSFALALLFRVEYSEALQEIPILIELIDEDGQPHGLRAEGKFGVGLQPTAKRGAPLKVPQALTFQMTQFQRAGDYTFRISSGGNELGSTIFRIAPMPMQSLVRPAS
jgi:hypothetical protein